MRPHYIPSSANLLFIVISLLIALLLNFLPWGQWPYIPDFVALVLVFWNIHQPQKVGIGIAFFMGLLMDVHKTTLLGQNVLAYTLLSYFTIILHRRMLWFSVIIQAACLLPLMLLKQLIQLIVQICINGKFCGWLYFSDSFFLA